MEIISVRIVDRYTNRALPLPYPFNLIDYKTKDGKYIRHIKFESDGTLRGAYSSTLNTAIVHDLIERILDYNYQYGIAYIEIDTTCCQKGYAHAIVYCGQ